MGTDAPESMGFAVNFGNNVHINLEPDTKAETRKLFCCLSAGGKVTMELQDMFWGAYLEAVSINMGCSGCLTARKKMIQHNLFRNFNWYSALLYTMIFPPTVIIAQSDSLKKDQINVRHDTSEFPNIRNKIKDQTFFIELDHNDLNAYIRRSLLEYQMGEYAACIKTTQKFYVWSLNSTDAYGNRGLSYVFLEKYKEAIEDLSKAIELARINLSVMSIGHLQKSQQRRELSGGDRWSWSITSLDSQYV